MVRSWTFQKKVSAGFAVMLALTVITSGVAAYALRAVVASKDGVISINCQNLTDAAKLNAAIDRKAAGFRGFLLTGEDRFLQERSAAAAEATGLLAGLRNRVFTEEGKRLLAEIAQADTALAAAQNRAMEVTKQKGGLTFAIGALHSEILPNRDRLVQLVKGFVGLEEQILDEQKRSASERASSAMAMVIVLAAIATLFAGLASFLLARALASQIGGVVQHVQSSSAELQTAANQQASGAKETATAIGEVSTTMSELLATSRQITESAQRVAHIAEETAKASESGNVNVTTTQEAIEAIRRQVDIVVGHMMDLGKKSQQVGEILDIINELAEQTNILAINASIEAAGAGEAGKRFAVVGNETRKLADRVAASTREIRGLVEEIRGAVNTTVMATESGSKATDTGLQHFEEVARQFKRITAMVATTTEAAREIELSTKQQATAVEQVNVAINSAAQASRETEVSSSQTLQTATELARVSHDLSQIVVVTGPHGAGLGPRWPEAFGSRT